MIYLWTTIFKKKINNKNLDESNLIINYPLFSSDELKKTNNPSTDILPSSNINCFASKNERKKAKKKKKQEIELAELDQYVIIDKDDL